MLRCWHINEWWPFALAVLDLDVERDLALALLEDRDRPEDIPQGEKIEDEEAYNHAIG
jgi:hypothetical protein